MAFHDLLGDIHVTGNVHVTVHRYYIIESLRVDRYGLLCDEDFQDVVDK